MFFIKKKIILKDTIVLIKILINTKYSIGILNHSNAFTPITFIIINGNKKKRKLGHTTHNKYFRTIYQICND